MVRASSHFTAIAMAQLFYYSSSSSNTARFVDQLGVEAERIPIEPDEPMPEPD